MTAHELLKLPVSANVIDPFESILREKVADLSSGKLSPEPKQEKQYADEKVNAAVSPQKNPRPKPFRYFEPERPRHGISL